MSEVIWGLVGRIIEALINAPAKERLARAKRALEVATGAAASEEILKRTLGRKQ